MRLTSAGVPVKTAGCEREIEVDRPVRAVAAEAAEWKGSVKDGAARGCCNRAGASTRGRGIRPSSPPASQLLSRWAAAP